MSSHLESRALYDEDFLLSNCDPSLYIEGSDFDTSTATYITNYIIGAIGVLGAYWHYKTSKLLSAYFLVSALSFTIAGVAHHVFENEDEEPFHALFQPSLHLALLSSLPLAFFIWDHRAVRICIVCVWAAVSIYTLVVQTGTVVAVYMPLMFIITSVYFGYTCRDWWSMAGCIFQVIGYVSVIAFRSGCGPDAYKTCWEDCIFPDPLKFNQNAVFHIFVAIGLLLQTVSRYEYQSTVATATGEEDLEAAVAAKKPPSETFQHDD